MLALVGLVASTSAYVCIKSGNGPCAHWASGQANMTTFLGSPSRTLLNGTHSWDENAVLAANDWNAQNGGFHFDVATGVNFNNPCGPRGPGHPCPNTGPAGDNPIFYTPNICGMDFGDAIEVTLNCWSPDSGAMINAPVFVRSTVQWNAYDGPIQRDINQVPIYDIRRVLLHELGHVLGLDHPDVNGQHVVAIMNSQVSNIDRLQPDDIAGLFSLYAPGTGPSQNLTPTSGCQVTTPAASWTGIATIGLALLLISRRSRSSHCQRR
ncbi:MAG: matrixin family metalloprotease [Deltaproteobacteria bacterium]|nr:matrixin family metalloprotease [Deltaproteobacteria bacterium]